MDIRPVVNWQSPEAMPNVAKGEVEKFWLAMRIKRKGEWFTTVIDAQYVNKPLEYDEDGDLLDDDCFVNEDGDPINALGWHHVMEHADFDGYYEPIEFDAERELLGWGQYLKPEFNGLGESV